MKMKLERKRRVMGKDRGNLLEESEAWDRGGNKEEDIAGKSAKRTVANEMRG